MDYKKKYENALEWARQVINGECGFIRNDVEEVFPELKESENERIRKGMLQGFKDYGEPEYVWWEGVKVKECIAWLEKQGKETSGEPSKDETDYCFTKMMDDVRRRSTIQVLEYARSLDTYNQYGKADIDKNIAWLENQVEYKTTWKPTIEQINALTHFIRSVGESGYASPYDQNTKLLYSLLTDLQILQKQGEQKEINLVEILKHYPNETELYSPLYGKLWLAEVDEKNGIITCYKQPLNKGCTRAILEQEDTVSFYSNGTTGLPDFNVSKNCMLFLYDAGNKGGQKLFDYENVNIQQKDFAPKSAIEANHEVKVDNANKVELKFKIGDWVVNNNSGGVYQITEIRDDEYCLWPLDGKIMGYLRIVEVDNDYHLWSINDAKNGDILACNGSIFIFKEEYMAGKPTAYCGLINGVFHVSSLSCLTNEKCYPATKEQQDLLFSKMKENGWVWNRETKELSQLKVTKISDQDWSEEDERNLKGIIDEIETNKNNAPDYDLATYDRFLFWLKSLKQRMQ